MSRFIGHKDRQSIYPVPNLLFAFIIKKNYSVQVLSSLLNKYKIESEAANFGLYVIKVQEYYSTIIQYRANIFHSTGSYILHGIHYSY